MARPLRPRPSMLGARTDANLPLPYHTSRLGRMSSNSISTAPPKSRSNATASTLYKGNQPPHARAAVTPHQLTTHAASCSHQRRPPPRRNSPHHRSQTRPPAAAILALSPPRQNARQPSPCRRKPACCNQVCTALPTSATAPPRSAAAHSNKSSASQACSTAIAKSSDLRNSASTSAGRKSDVGKEQARGWVSVSLGGGNNRNTPVSSNNNNICTCHKRHVQRARHADLQDTTTVSARGAAAVCIARSGAGRAPRWAALWREEPPAAAPRSSHVGSRSAAGRVALEILLTRTEMTNTKGEVIDTRKGHG
jgi:hypothetical protein